MRGSFFVLFLIISLLISGCTSNSDKSDPANQVADVSEPQPGTNSQTQISADMVCILAHKEQVFTDASKTAWAFNLVNPPMYINYTIPQTKKGADGKDNSYYVITVREKDSGTILSQAGFGKMSGSGYFGYPFNGYDVIRLMKSDNLLVEFEGKDITIIYDIWANPTGNVDSSFNINTAKCIRWPQEYRQGVMHSSGMSIAIDRGDN